MKRLLIWKKAKFCCTECDYETNDKSTLDNHMSLSHQFVNKSRFTCVSCAQGFEIKGSLIRHRRSAHGKSKMKCRYYAENRCMFKENNGEECLYDHSDTIQVGTSNGSVQSNDRINCNSCEETFTFKSAFLKHRKAKHPGTVPDCKSYKEGRSCLFGDLCGFSHKTKNKSHMTTEHVIPEDSSSDKYSTPPKTSENFWEAQKTKNPPDQMAEIMLLLQTMMKDIQQLKEQQKLTSKN